MFLNNHKYRRWSPLVSAGLGSWNLWRCSSSTMGCPTGWGVGSCQRQGAVELVAPALPTLKAVSACRCRCCQLKRICKQGNCLMTEGVLLAAALLDGCLFNNLLAAAVLGLCWPAVWQDGILPPPQYLTQHLKDLRSQPWMEILMEIHLVLQICADQEFLWKPPAVHFCSKFAATELKPLCWPG